MDNAMAGLTCTGPYLGWSRSRRIRLCKQGVVGSSPIISTTTTNALLSMGTGAPSLG
jgi:hypothetical protein